MSRRVSGALAAAVALALTSALAVAFAGAVAAVASARGVAPARCRVDRLSARLAPRTPAVGAQRATLVLTNHSRSDCTLDGYLGLTLLWPHGQVLPSHIDDDRTPAPRPVRLPPSGQAQTVLRWSETPGRGDSPSGCPIPLRLSIAPPAATRQILAAWGATAQICERGTIHISALARVRG